MNEPTEREFLEGLRYEDKFSVWDRVLVNDERTVLVNIWSTGEVEVAFRADRSAVWGPPIRVAEDA